MTDHPNLAVSDNGNDDAAIVCDSSYTECTQSTTGVPRAEHHFKVTVFCRLSSRHMDKRRNLLMHPVGIPYAKLLTKFEVYSPNNFEDIWDRLPEILGVT